ncbi:MAG: hypothetical protein ACLUIX_10370 [Oscillospiraceae bacterium]
MTATKHRCTIGDDVFLGCNTNLIAPVTVADRYTAAGSTVTDDVPEGALAIARQRQTSIRAGRTGCGKRGRNNVSYDGSRLNISAPRERNFWNMIESECVKQ